MAVPTPVPVTTPVLLMKATEDGAQLHVPPATVLLNVIVLPTQTGVLPEMAPGNAITVTIAVTVPQVVT